MRTILLTILEIAGVAVVLLPCLVVSALTIRLAVRNLAREIRKGRRL